MTSNIKKTRIKIGKQKGQNKTITNKSKNKMAHSKNLWRFKICGDLILKLYSIFNFAQIIVATFCDVLIFTTKFV